MLLVPRTARYRPHSRQTVARRVSLAAACAVAVLTAACHDDPMSAVAGAPARRATAASADAARGRRTTDDKFVELAGRVPGFGGLYFGPGGTVEVYLIDTTTAAVARPVIDAFLRAEHASLASAALPIRVHVGRFDFPALADMHRRVRAALPRLGITQTDVDEQRN